MSNSSSIVIFDHSGCGNHGCEALVRTTLMLLSSLSKKSITLISWQPDEDKKYLSDVSIDVVSRSINMSPIFHVIAKIWKILTNSMFIYDVFDRHEILKIKDSLCISIGGDNYCYSDYDAYCRENRYLNLHGNKTVLWGCSVEPELLKKDNVIESMKLYSLITARESLTYNAMREVGLSNILYCPDTAFLLPTQSVDLPEIFSKDVVGINVSPMILEYEAKSGMTMRNYEKLIRFILKNTDMNIALIPHVIVPWGDDLIPLNLLKKKFVSESRIQLINTNKTMNCCQLKYIISKCKIIVAARTHASIAAYSSNVPALVTGYSVKARGIANDIFGSCEHFVCPVQNLNNDYTLTEEFIHILDNINNIKENLVRYNNKCLTIFPSVCERVQYLINND